MITQLKNSWRFRRRASRKQFIDRHRGRVEEIVNDQLEATNRFYEVRGLWKFDPTHAKFDQKQFVGVVVQRLRTNNQECGSLPLLILTWILQGTVIHFVQKWWRDRHNRQL